MKYLFLLLALTVAIIAGKLIAPKARGKLGEAAVGAKLAKLPKEEYAVFNDIMIQTARGTAQIDHVVVSKYGIFVIETKNYKGWILGGESSEQWTKNVYGKKYYFRNPIKQNYGHIKALEGVLELPASVFVPIVVFSRRATIKVKTSQHVIYAAQLLNTIKSYQQLVLTSDDVQRIVKKLEELNITDSGARREHVSNIRNEIKDTNEKVKSGVCPKCGGRLILRDGKYGRFLGCSNYPKCRYTSRY